MKKYIKSTMYIAFVAHIIIMIYLLFLQRIAPVQNGKYLKLLSENFNLFPFKTIL